VVVYPVGSPIASCTFLTVEVPFLQRTFKISSSASVGFGILIVAMPLGHVTLDPILKDRKVSVALLTLKVPDGIKPEDLQGNGLATLSPDHDFVTSPLPFGGTYAVLLDAGPSYYVSASTVVDAEHPLVVRDIQATTLSDKITGKFVDETGKSVANQEVMLTYHPTEHQAMTFDAATTDGNGAFAISNMNFPVLGNYEVQIYGNDWEPSKIRIDGHTLQPVIISLRPRAK
jgi:hypothetical protein